MRWTQKLLNRAVARLYDGREVPLSTIEQRQYALDETAPASHVGIYLDGKCVDTWETAIPAGTPPPLVIPLLNTSIITAEGTFEFHYITLDGARRILADADGVTSHVGHDSTAAIMTELLGVDVPMSRVPFEQMPGQEALVFKLNGRPPEGRILSREEIESVGYSWGLLIRRG